MITGTPWHVSTGDLAKDERRHRARCIHYNKEEKFCNYRSSNCVGAAHCLTYSENDRVLRSCVLQNTLIARNYLYKIIIKANKFDEDIVTWFVENFPRFKRDVGFYIRMFPSYEQLKSFTKLFAKKNKYIENFNLILDGINDSLIQADKYLLEFDLDRFLDILNEKNDYVFKINIHDKSSQNLDIAEIIYECFEDQELSAMYSSFYSAIKIPQSSKDSLEKCMIAISGKESYNYRELKSCICGAISITSTKTIFFDFKKFLFLHECLFC